MPLVQRLPSHKAYFVINGPDALSDWRGRVFELVDIRIFFYESNMALLPPRPRFGFRHLGVGIWNFHDGFVLAPLGRASNNVTMTDAQC